MTSPIPKHRPAAAPKAATAAPAADPDAAVCRPDTAEARTDSPAAWKPKAGGAKQTGTTAPTDQALAEDMRAQTSAARPVAFGSQGPEVKQLQTSLKSLGYQLATDGKWGPGTDAAVTAFAHNNQLQLGAKHALTPEVTKALTLKLESGAVSGALTRASNAILGSQPLFFEHAEKAFRDADAEKDPAKKQALVNDFVDKTTAFAEEHGADLAKTDPDWKKDFELLGRHIKDVATLPNADAELKQMQHQFNDVAKQRMGSNVATLSDALSKTDPQKAQEFLKLMDGLQTADPKDVKPENELGKFLRGVEQQGTQLTPAAKRAVVELAGSALDAQRTGGTKAFSDFARDTFVRHTLDAVKPDPHNPAQIELSNDLKTRLKKLEDAADKKVPTAVTGAQLRAIVPDLKPARADELAVAMSHAMDQAKITTTRERAAFIAQCAHESGGFKWMHELGGPSYFLKYDNRTDLGNRGHPDGETFKGRGWLQLTGRSNYQAFSRAQFNDDQLVAHPERVEQPELASASAAWYWMKHGLNRPADRGDFKAVTIGINGGTNGWDDRVRLYTKALAALT
jgi:putative chitinase